ncbi:MAG: transglutaminase-like domain-containing protein, partial [Acidimicrobiia bacterium]|nr:transglutaminase-like domain-containing protein [Acidimicrobiia bacterium]
MIGSLDELASGASDGSTTGLLRYVFSTLGFAGNIDRYYLPSNSLLHRVLDTRLGNPLSLSIITSELSRRLGGRMCVVGFPGHVLIGDDEEHPTRWFDPFLGGAGMDLAGCRSLLARRRR